MATNGLLLYVFVKNLALLKELTNQLLLSLCLIQLGVTITNMPIAMMSAVFSCWDFSVALCTFQGLLTSTLHTLYLLSILALNFDRFAALVWSAQYMSLKLSYKVVLVALLWIFGTSSTLVLLFVIGGESTTGAGVSYSPQLLLCHLYYDSGVHGDKSYDLSSHIYVRTLQLFPLVSATIGTPISAIGIYLKCRKSLSKPWLRNSIEQARSNQRASDNFRVLPRRLISKKYIFAPTISLLLLTSPIIWERTLFSLAQTSTNDNLNSKMQQSAFYGSKGLNRLSVAEDASSALTLSKGRLSATDQSHIWSHLLLILHYIGVATNPLLYGLLSNWSVARALTKAINMIANNKTDESDSNNVSSRADICVEQRPTRRPHRDSVSDRMTQRTHRFLLVKESFDKMVGKTTKGRKDDLRAVNIKRPNTVAQSTINPEIGNRQNSTDRERGMRQNSTDWQPFIRQNSMFKAGYPNYLSRITTSPHEHERCEHIFNQLPLERINLEAPQWLFHPNYAQNDYAKTSQHRDNWSSTATSRCPPYLYINSIVEDQSIAMPSTSHNQWGDPNSINRPFQHVSRLSTQSSLVTISTDMCGDEEVLTATIQL